MADLNNLIVDQFYRTTLRTTTDPGLTTIEVENADGFPDLAVGKFFYLTLVQGNVAKVFTIVGVDKPGRVLTASEVLGTPTFSAGTGRAEHWFTAQAFQDIQEFLEDLDETVNVIPPDDITIENSGGTLSVKQITQAQMAAEGDLGISETDLIQKDNMGDASVGTDQLVGDGATNGCVTNLKIDPVNGIDATKIRSYGESVPGAGDGTKLPIQTIPEINFAQIDYAVGTPSSPGEEGDIWIEWEDVV